MYAVNQLPKRDTAASPTGCCPKFDPVGWDGHVLRFDNKLFMKVTTRSFLHMPLNMNSVMQDAMQRIDAAGARSSDEYIMLSDEISPWKCDHYLSVDKEVPGEDMVQLNGTYLAKVFKGPFKDVGMWHEQLASYVKSRGYKLVRMYFSYTTCPSCAKAYGKNYVVGFAKVEKRVNDDA
jgi:hypothetical protein